MVETARFTFRFGEPRVVPAGWPPDVAPHDVITANHMNAVKTSVYGWPGDVNGGGMALTNVGRIESPVYRSNVDMAFQVGAGFPERVRITAAAGNLGIGTPSPAMKCHLYGLGQSGTTGALAIYDSTSHGASLFLQSSDAVGGSGGALVFGSPFTAGYFAAIKGHTVSGSGPVGDIVFLTRGNPAWAHIQESMRLTYYGQLSIGNSWDLAHFVMGTYHLWVDSSGRLRIKNGAPTGDTDGSTVGTQS